MYLDTVLRSQFGKPSGLIGSVFMAPLLNVANTRLITATIDLLDPAAKDRVLDVGFGGGYSLLRLADIAPRARVTGVDYSAEMVESAAALISRSHLDSRVSVKCADVADLPFPARTFDKVLTVNSIYYWSNLRAGLRETARVLKPHGRIAVGFRSAASLRPFTLDWERFWLYEPREFAEILEKSGFRLVTLQHRDRWRIPDLVVALGERK